MKIIDEPGTGRPVRVILVVYFDCIQRRKELPMGPVPRHASCPTLLRGGAFFNIKLIQRMDLNLSLYNNSALRRPASAARNLAWVSMVWLRIVWRKATCQPSPPSSRPFCLSGILNYALDWSTWGNGVRNELFQPLLQFWTMIREMNEWNEDRHPIRFIQSCFDASAARAFSC